MSDVMFNQIKRSAQSRKLYQAAATGDLEGMDAAISRGADLDKLHRVSGDQNFVGRLERTGPVSSRTIVYNDVYRTPLMIAGINGHTDAIRKLDGYGVNLDRENFYGETAVGLSMAAEEPESVRVLRELGAKVRPIDRAMVSIRLIRLDIDRRVNQEIAEEVKVIERN
jgi:hypothetical protein